MLSYISGLGGSRVVVCIPLGKWVHSDFNYQCLLSFVKYNKRFTAVVISFLKSLNLLIPLKKKRASLEPFHWDTLNPDLFPLSSSPSKTVEVTLSLFPFERHTIVYRIVVGQGFYYLMFDQSPFTYSLSLSHLGKTEFC